MENKYGPRGPAGNKKSTEIIMMKTINLLDCKRWQYADRSNFEMGDQ